MNRYRELIVWQEAMDLVEGIYSITQGFPGDEKFGLVSQIRRSAVSVPSNIAEGAGRNNPKEFNQFLGIAMGSCSELDTQIEISIRLNYLEKENADEVLKKIEKIKNMIFKLQRSL